MVTSISNVLCHDISMLKVKYHGIVYYQTMPFPMPIVQQCRICALFLPPNTSLCQTQNMCKIGVACLHKRHCSNKAMRTFFDGWWWWLWWWWLLWRWWWLLWWWWWCMMPNVMKCKISQNADADADDGSMTPCRNDQRYTLRSIQSSPGRSFLAPKELL